MSKLALFRTAIRSSLAVRTIGSAAHSRGFSTQPEQPPPSPQPRNSFSQSRSSGSVYVRLFGVTKNTLRTDIVNVLEGCDVTQDDVRVEYNNIYIPKSMLVRLPSSQALGQANKMIARKGRLYRFDKVEQVHWDSLAPYEGKAVLLQGIPQVAITPDVERFLLGCNYYDSSIQLFFRAGAQGKMATVRFPSQYEANNCFISKNKSFCLNNQVQVRVLQ